MRSRTVVGYGAGGQHGKIAVVERAIRTRKELLRLLVLIPVRAATFRHEVQLIVDWYNTRQPHAGRSLLREIPGLPSAAP